MSINTLVIGESGTGKTRSIFELDPKTTFLINVNGKPLTFKCAGNYVEGKNLANTDNAETIIKGIIHVDKNRPDIKIGIIDDAQYIMANEFMRRAKEKGYDKFNEIGEKYWTILWQCQMCRKDLMWFILSHNEIDDTGKSRIKTIGKMLNDKICIEGMFSIVLNTVVDDKKYFFETQNSGHNTTKTPEGMFEDYRIPNSLKYVSEKINAYYKGE